MYTYALLGSPLGKNTGGFPKKTVRTTVNTNNPNIPTIDRYGRHPFRNALKVARYRSINHGKKER
jgi:hypothetical protein